MKKAEKNKDLLIVEEENKESLDGTVTVVDTDQSIETEVISEEVVEANQADKDNAKESNNDSKKSTPKPKNDLEANYYNMPDEQAYSPIKDIFSSLKSSFKKKKKKSRRKKFNPLASVHATRYEPDPKEGLNEDQVLERYNNDLINLVENKYSKSYKSIFASNIFTFFNLLGVLCAIALIYAKAEMSNFFFCIIYVFNIVIGIVQEIRSKLSIEKLSLLSNKTSKVIRSGVEVEIASDEIVLDDIIKFSLGNQISTDSVIVDGTIEVNESLLTGESVAIRKTVGDKLYAGSFVTSGNCLARADKVGKENYVEILSAKAKKYRKPHSELMRSIRLIITIVGLLIVPIAVGMYLKTVLTTDTQSAVKATAAVIIGMIPSGMILLTSVALAVGVIRLTKNNTLVQDLYSLEMLARVDVLCLDKTGTITDGRMKVNDCILLNNNAPNTINEIMGSMLAALNDNNQTSIALNNHFGRNNALKPTKVLPFNSSRKLSAVSFEDVGTYAFGAPEFVMKEVPDNVQKMIKQYASMGLRVLLLCYSKASISNDNVPATMKPVALITITDNIREDAVSTIKWFKDNGVQIKIISGDNPVTVSEVARRVGVENAHKYISLEGLSESDIINIANEYTVFGRVTPEQKAILIRAMKAAGHTTAMTGDGVNDILALKEANCAISVGSGSDAARNVSHLVLMDSNFSSMPKVVREGRRVINNIQNSASLYLMKTLFITFLAALMITIPGITYPFQTSNLMLLEILVIGVPSFFLSLQANNNKVKGKFINYVISKSLPGALLMLISVLLVQFAQLMLTPIYGIAPYNYSPEIYTTMCVLAMSSAGLIMLFRICQPFNVFRGVMFTLIFILFSFWIVYALVRGDNILLHIVSMSPLKEYWHHILILVSLVVLNIPLSGWLINATNSMRDTDETKEEKEA